MSAGEPSGDRARGRADEAAGGGRVEPDERVELGERVVLPGGKVDPEALRRLIEERRARRGSHRPPQAAVGGTNGGAGAGDVVGADEDEPADDGDDDAAVGRVTFTLQRDLNSRLDKYLTSRITFMSRNQLQKLIAGGGVLVNERAAKASTNLRRGDVVEVMIPEPPPQGIQAEEIPLEVLFEDEHLVVVNKSPDIIVHPARSHLKGTMVNALAWHFARRGGSLSSVGGEFARPGVVHRLDRHTSGVIVFAKRDEAHWKLGHQFEHRRVDKRYLALVHGAIEPAADVVELPIGPHPSREKGYREKYVVRHDEQGKHAVTIYRVRESYEVRVANGVSGAVERGVPHSALRRAEGRELVERFTLVELELKTGRTHQIRVHLSHLGWPIVGDDMYGGRALVIGEGLGSGEGRVGGGQWGVGSGQESVRRVEAARGVRVVLGRQALHATVLGFTHPATGQRMEFTAPLRGDMAEAVRLLRRCGTVKRLEAAGATVDLAKAVGE